jgi:hypothetical protein
MSTLAQPGKRLPTFVVWFAVVALLALAAFGVRRMFRPAGPAPVLPRAELALRDGRLCVTQSGLPFTGWMTETNAVGGLLSRSSVSNGLLEGVSEGYHTNGQLQVREHFRGNISHGPRTKWHANGVKASEATVVSGKLEGWFVRWAEDASLAEEISMKAGQPDGPSRSYFPSGCIKAEVVLQAGKVVKQQYWEDGQQRVPFLTTNAPPPVASP